MEDEVAKLLAELSLGKLENFDWAIKCLEKGYDSKSLRILASTNKFDSSSERQEYLKRSLNELNWARFEREDYLIRYAKILADEIIKDNADPIQTSREIYQIMKESDYPSEFYGWYEIDDMIWDYEYFLKTGKQGHFYRPKEELIKEIKRVSKDLIK